MAKNRNKNKKRDAVSMDTSEVTASKLPQGMDTSDSGAQKPFSSVLNKTKMKGRPMKRTKNVRKMKAVAKAISKSEKSSEKVSKMDDKVSRIQSAKKLYE